jgi:acyl-CoA thioesterase FadM
MVAFEYSIRNAATGATLATGATKHIFLDAEMRPVKLPEKYFEFFGITSQNRT